MPERKPALRILLTAFEPFDGRAKNASAEAVKLLMEKPLPAGMEVIVCLLPVETGAASEQVRGAILEHQPDYVLSVGEAKRDAICIETVAYNERLFTIPDNSGQLLEGSPVISDGPASYSATLPVEALFQAIERTRVPVRLSDDAGRYLCNEVMYSSLHIAAHHDLPVCAGFVHVPHLPEAAVEPDYPSMPSEDAVQALLAVLVTLASLKRIKAQTPETSENRSG